MSRMHFEVSAGVWSLAIPFLCCNIMKMRDGEQDTITKMAAEAERFTAIDGHLRDLSVKEKRLRELHQKLTEAHEARLSSQNLQRAAIEAKIKETVSSNESLEKDVDALRLQSEEASYKLLQHRRMLKRLKRARGINEKALAADQKRQDEIPQRKSLQQELEQLEAQVKNLKENELDRDNLAVAARSSLDSGVKQLAALREQHTVLLEAVADESEVAAELIEVQEKLDMHKEATEDDTHSHDQAVADLEREILHMKELVEQADQRKKSAEAAKRKGHDRPDLGEDLRRKAALLEQLKELEGDFVIAQLTATAKALEDTLQTMQAASDILDAEMDKLADQMEQKGAALQKMAEKRRKRLEDLAGEIRRQVDDADFLKEHEETSDVEFVKAAAAWAEQKKADEQKALDGMNQTTNTLNDELASIEKSMVATVTMIDIEDARTKAAAAAEKLRKRKQRRALLLGLKTGLSSLVTALKKSPLLLDEGWHLSPKMLDAVEKRVGVAKRLGFPLTRFDFVPHEVEGVTRPMRTVGSTVWEQLRNFQEQIPVICGELASLEAVDSIIDTVFDARLDDARAERRRLDVRRRLGELRMLLRGLDAWLHFSGGQRAALATLLLVPTGHDSALRERLDMSCSLRPAVMREYIRLVDRPLLKAAFRNEDFPAYLKVDGLLRELREQLLDAERVFPMSIGARELAVEGSAWLMDHLAIETLFVAVQTKLSEAGGGIFKLDEAKVDHSLLCNLDESALTNKVELSTDLAPEAKERLKATLEKTLSGLEIESMGAAISTTIDSKMLQFNRESTERGLATQAKIDQISAERVHLYGSETVELMGLWFYVRKMMWSIATLHDENLSKFKYPMLRVRQMFDTMNLEWEHVAKNYPGVASMVAEMVDQEEREDLLFVLERDLQEEKGERVSTAMERASEFIVIAGRALRSLFGEGFSSQQLNHMKIGTRDPDIVAADDIVSLANVQKMTQKLKPVLENETRVEFIASFWASRQGFLEAMDPVDIATIDLNDESTWLAVFAAILSCQSFQMQSFWLGEEYPWGAQARMYVTARSSAQLDVILDRDLLLYPSLLGYNAVTVANNWILQHQGEYIEFRLPGAANLQDRHDIGGLGGADRKELLDKWYSIGYFIEILRNRIQCPERMNALGKWAQLYFMLLAMNYINIRSAVQVEYDSAALLEFYEQFNSTVGTFGPIISELLPAPARASAAALVLDRHIRKDANRYYDLDFNAVAKELLNNLHSRVADANQTGEAAYRDIYGLEYFQERWPAP